MLGLLLFASGAAGLVYETLWARGLALALGSTALAQAAVLASFLGGLALGSAVLGAAVEKSARPLKLFSRLELLVALCGALSVPALPLLHLLPAGPSRFLAAALGVGLPAFFMGGTLPSLLRARGKGAGWERELSSLYALNSAGAACGALASTLLLLPRLGFDLSLLAAAAVSAGVGLLARRLDLAGSSPAPSAPAGESVAAPSLYAAALLSGFAALTCEAAWTRLLGLTLGSSTHAFALMLAAFITGVAAGGFALARGLFPALGARALCARLQLCAAFSVLAGLPLWGALPYVFLRFGAAVPREPAFFPLYQAGQFAFCLLVMAPPAFFLGAALPLAARLDPGGGRASAAGRVWAVNTAGNVLAALAALRLMPALGLRGLLLLAAAANAAAGLLLLARRERLTGAALAAVALAGGAFAAPWDGRLFALGAYRRDARAVPTYAQLRAMLSAQTLEFAADDRDASVAVVREPSGRLYLKTNGKTDASDGADMATQRLLAHLPLALNPGAKSALVIGLGSGVTAGAALRHPLQRLDAAELVPAVVDASRLFDHVSGSPLSDPRLRLHVGDARSLLEGDGPRWDVIVSQPSNPWVAGEAGLFTREFYAAARARLAPGGVMTQWFHVYEMDDDTLRMVLRTFASAFPAVSVWHAGPGDVLFLGSERPLAPDATAAAAALARPGVREPLAAIGVEGLTGLLSLQAQHDALARELAGPGRLHEDGFPWLEFLAPRAFFLDRSSGLLDWADAMRRKDGEPELLLWRLRRGRPLSGAERASIAALRVRLSLPPAFAR